MSVYEMTMLVCFGASWPFSIIRSWKARVNSGKSVVFLWLVLAGYAAGIMHKILHNLDLVIAFYILNAVMVAADIAIYYRNAFIKRAGSS